MVYKKSKLESGGFTIIELMIAISVLSVIMLVSSSAIIFIARQYQNGVTRTTLQSASRQLHQKITDSIKFSDSEIISTSNSGYSAICIGSSRYFFKTPDSTLDSPLKIDNMSNLFYNTRNTEYNNIECGNDLIESSSTRLLPNNSRVAQAKINCSDESPKSCSIKTSFISGDGDLFIVNPAVTADGLRCKSGIGNQWCSIVNLSSIVNSKL